MKTLDTIEDDIIQNVKLDDKTFKIFALVVCIILLVIKLKNY